MEAPERGNFRFRILCVYDPSVPVLNGSFVEHVDFLPFIESD